MAVWSLVACVLVLTVIENISTTEEQAMAGMPLSRSLGFPKSLDDARAGEEYVALYNEMLRASMDAARQHGEDDALLATDLMRLKGVTERRRSSRNLSSPVKTRRARCEAVRREKLNSQSLRSHKQHSRHSSLEHTWK